MKAILNEKRVKCEQVYHNNGLRVLRYKKPHYIYTSDDSNYIQNSSITRRDRNTWVEKRVFYSEYIYRIVISPELRAKVKENGGKISNYWYDNTLSIDRNSYNILTNLTGYDFTNVHTQLTNEHISFRNDSVEGNVNYADDDWSTIIYDLTKYKEVFELTKKEQAEKDAKDKKEFFEKFFGSLLEQIAEKYGIRYDGFVGNCAYFYRNKSIENSIHNKLVEMVSEYLNNTIVKDLNELGFTMEIDKEKLGDNLQYVVYSAKYKEELVKKEE